MNSSKSFNSVPDSALESEKLDKSLDDGDERRGRSFRRSRSVGDDPGDDFGSQSSRSDSPIRGSRSVSQSRSPSPNGDRRSRGRSGSPSKRRSGSSRSRSRSRSKSPSKFGEKDFRGKLTSQASLKRRQNALAKVRGLKVDMSDWSKQELMDKIKSFAKWIVSKKTGACELIVQDKRLLNEDVEAIKELLRRNTEAQVISLNNCSLTDEQFAQIGVGLKGQRHVKELHLRFNLLGIESAHLLVKLFSMASRPLQLLDTQGNTNMSFTDGRLLYSAFRGLPSLNSIPVQSYQPAVDSSTRKLPAQSSLSASPFSSPRDAVESESIAVLSLPGKALRNTEVAIVCMILEQLDSVVTVELSDNLINAEGLSYLVDTISHCNTIVSLDISHNPLTENLSLDKPDLSGLKILLRFFQSSTRMQQCDWSGVHDVPVQLDELLSQALMTNRAVKGSWDGDHFNKFATSLIEKFAPPLPVNKLKGWKGGIREVDVAFVKNNRLPVMAVSVNTGSSTIQTSGMKVEADEIVLEKVPQFVRPPIHY